VVSGPRGVTWRRSDRVSGPRRVRELIRGTDETLGEIHVEFSKVRDLGDRIVATGHLRIRGKESGAETESPVGSVAELKDGKPIRIRTYLDPQDALEAAGLRE
jgi:ketosteroid isomerase-like protein